MLFRSLEQPQNPQVPCGEAVHQIQEHKLEVVFGGFPDCYVEHGVAQRLAFFRLMIPDCSLTCVQNNRNECIIIVEVLDPEALDFPFHLRQPLGYLIHPLGSPLVQWWGNHDSEKFSGKIADKRGTSNRSLYKGVCHVANLALRWFVLRFGQRTVAKRRSLEFTEHKEPRGKARFPSVMLPSGQTQNFD